MLTKCAVAGVVLSLSAFGLRGASLGAESHAIPVLTHEAMDSRAAFERLKRLEGTWSYTVDGRSSTQTATYRVTGGGRVIVENMGGMMTTYHFDGDKLMLTHYCGAGNQPRMRLENVDDRHIGFAMFDITNLSSPRAYHSTHLDVTVLSEDRVDLAYRGTEAGKERTQVFRLTRK